MHRRHLKPGARFIPSVLLALLFLVGLFAFVSTPHTEAATNRLLPFSARLTAASSSDPAPDGNYDISFTIYDAETGGTALWTEKQTLGVTGGIVSAVLGEVTPFPSTLNFEAGPYYFGIRVGDDDEMSPRKKVAAVPLAFNANTVGGFSAGTGANNVLVLDNAGDINITGSVITTSALQGGSLATAGSLTVGGTANLGSDLQVTGSTSLTGGLGVTGNITVAGNIIPSTGGTYDLGTSSNPFNSLYVSNLVVGSTSTSGTTSSSFTLNQDATVDEDSALNFYRGGSLATAQLLWSSANDRFELNQGLLVSGGISSPGTGLGTEQFGSGATTGSASYATAIGNGATASGGGAVAIGTAASASGTSSIAIGRASGTGGRTGSIVIGFNVSSTANNQLIIGSAAGGHGISNAYIGNGVTNSAPIDLVLQGTGGSGTDITGASVAIAGGKGTGAASGGAINFQTSDSVVSGTTLQSLTTKMTILANGNVGIGTSNPTYPLQVSGGLRVTGDTVYGTSGGYTLYANGNANLGTTHFGGNKAFAGVSGLRVTSDGSVGFTNGLYTSSSSVDIRLVRESASVIGFMDATTGYTSLKALNGQFTGTVGIGTAPSAHALDVAGSVNVSSSFKVNGSTVCDSTGCIASANSGNYIQNGTSSQAGANFNIAGNGVIGGTLAVTGTINGAAISGGTLSGGTLSGGTYSNTSVTGSGAYSVIAQGGNINMQASTGITSFNQSSVQNQIRVYASNNTSYISMTHDGSNGVVSSSSGELQLSGQGSNQFILGDVGSAVNLVFEESSTISGQGGNAITLGQAGDTFNLNQSGVTYNIGALNSSATLLTTSSTSSTALTVAAPTATSGNLLDLQVGGVSKFAVSSAGNLTVAGVTLCTSSGCAASANSTSYIQNGTSLQASSNFNISGNGAIAGNLSSGSSANGILTLQANTATTGNTAANSAIQLKVGDSGATTALTALNSGNVGIGASLTVGSQLRFDTNNNFSDTSSMILSSTGVKLSGTQGNIKWTNQTFVTGGGILVDLGLERYAAGVLKVTNGSTGYGTLIAGNVGINTATPQGKLEIAGAPTASAATGLFNIGSASTSFDGATAGFFAGSATGTQLAMNAATGYAGNLVDLQVAGSSKFKLDASGNLTIAGSITTSTVTSASALAITSSTNGNINITPNGTGKITLNTSGNVSSAVIIGDGGTANYAKFDSTGALSFSGTARPSSEQVLIPADATFPSSAACSLSSATTGSDGSNPIVYKTVDCTATDKDAFWEMKMPSNYVSGSNIAVDVFWMANTTSGAATWDVGYASVGTSSNWDGAAITNVAGGPTTTNASAKFLNNSTVTLTAPSINANDLVSLRVRNSANTLGVNAQIVKIQVKYLVGN